MISDTTDQTVAYRAMLVACKTPDQGDDEAQDLLAELGELCDTLGVAVVASRVIRIRKWQSHYLIGTGNAEDIIAYCKNNDVNILVFDNELSPSQQRNWERAAEIKVIDRREVILDIFATRASTREAVLQVELAKADYELPRLKRAWTHLSRQQGGVGVRGGEGEKQLEVDERIIHRRIAKLRRDLAAVKKRRGEQRKKRQQRPVPNAALVGYTNAGKSSLLNYLTDADSFVQDKLFATLDPTTRQLYLSGSNQIVLLTDTVGFIRKLPHDLVEAFKATLEESVLASFLIQVVDVTTPKVDEHLRTTSEVLEQIGAVGKEMIIAFNKIDLVTEPYVISRLRRRFPEAIFISTKTGEGMPTLIAEIERLVEAESDELSLRIPTERYDVVARLHRICRVVNEVHDDDGISLTVRLPSCNRPEFREYIVDEGALQKCS